jgi:hypothetical protein
MAQSAVTVWVRCRLSGTFVADARRDGMRYVVRADGKLPAFVELEAGIRAGEPLNISHLS